MIDFTCPHCQMALKISDEYLGHTGTCDHCGNSIRIAKAPPPIPETIPSTDVLIAFDLETSGLHPSDADITEVGAVKFTLNGQQRGGTPTMEVTPSKLNWTRGNFVYDLNVRTFGTCSESVSDGRGWLSIESGEEGACNGRIRFKWMRGTGHTPKRRANRTQKRRR